MGKLKRMDQIKRLLRTYQATNSIKATAMQLQLSKNTVRHYLRLAQAASTDLEQVLTLDDGALHEVLYPDRAGPAADRRLLFEGKVDYWIRELQRPHVTRQTLFEEYRREFPDGYAQTQFYDYLSRAIGRRDLTLALTHQPGEKLQVDYAGKTLAWVDERSGEVHHCQVLVAVLPHSQHTFAIALPSQSTADFVYGIGEALRFFGALPRVIVSDNLKAFVIRGDRYEPDFNEACVQLGHHYRIDLQAARVRKPRDKASVENAVGIAYGRLYAPLRDEVFHSLEALNRGLRDQLVLHRERPFQKRPGSRIQVFRERELPLMRALPPEPFELRTTVSAKVQRNYHVYLGQEKNFYSVPFQYVGSQATVIYSRSRVEIFIGPERVATHSRLHPSDRYQYRTEAAHLPRNHAEWRISEGYDAAYFRARATEIGPATAWAIGNILRKKFQESQAYRSCQGTLALAKTYSPARLEAAAERCRTAGQATYSMLRTILERGLDHQAADEADLFTPPPDHDNIRGSTAYH